MRDIVTLTKRNMLAYIKDRVSVFFSFLSVLILIALYFMFLGSMFDNIPLSENNKFIFKMGYIMGGVIVVGTVTISLGVIGVFVNDIAAKRINGFLVTPVKRYKITLSYFLSTAIVTQVFSLAMLFITVLIVGIVSGYWYSASTLFQAIATVFLYVLISAPLMVFITSFVKSMNAFGAVSSIVGTLIGFISGIYIPLTVLDKFTKTLAGLLPFSHMALNLRKLLISEEVLNILPIEAINSVGLEDIKIFKFTPPLYLVYVISIALSIGLLILAYFRISKKHKK